MIDDRPTAVFPLCAHIKRDGNQCGSAAMKGLRFCFQHIGGTTSSLLRARSTTSFRHEDIDFAYPGDRESIQHNFFLIAQALKEGRIDVSIANTYIRLYRASEQNLHRWEKAQRQKQKEQEKQQKEQQQQKPHQEKPEGAPFKRSLSGEQNQTQPEPAPLRMKPLAADPIPADASPTGNPGAPCLEETWENAASSQSTGNPGAPSFRAPESSPTAFSSSRERVGEQESLPDSDEELIATMAPETQKNIAILIARPVTGASPASNAGADN